MFQSCRIYWTDWLLLFKDPTRAAQKPDSVFNLSFLSSTFVYPSLNQAGCWAGTPLSRNILFYMQILHLMSQLHIKHSELRTCEGFEKPATNFMTINQLIFLF